MTLRVASPHGRAANLGDSGFMLIRVITFGRKAFGLGDAGAAPPAGRPAAGAAGGGAAGAAGAGAGGGPEGRGQMRAEVVYRTPQQVGPRFDQFTPSSF